MGWLLDGILTWLAQAILDCLDTIINAITEALLITPDVTTLPQVRALSDRSVLIVDAVFVLVFLAAGALTMLAGGDERARYTAKDLLPRCVVGFVAAHFSQLLAGMLIEAANALTGAITSGDIGGDGELAPNPLSAIKTHLLAARDQTAGLLFVVCATIIVILLATTAISMIVRFAVVLVLTTAAPLALACHALPQTDTVARLWWRAYLGTLAVPVVQGFFLYAGGWLLTNSDTMLPVLGLPADPGGFVNLFVVMVVLWTTTRVPGLMRRYVAAGGRTPNVLGTAVRVVLVQQLSRAVPGLGRGVRAVTR